MRGLACLVVVSAALSSGFAVAALQSPAQPQPTIAAPARPTPTPVTSPSGADFWATVGGHVETFNHVFDFVARLVTLILVAIALVLLVRYRRYIDWPRTGNELIAKRTPIQLQTRETQASPGIPEPTQAPAPPTARPPTPPQPPATGVAADYLTIRQFGQVVFTTDRPYQITGVRLVFDKLLVKGNPDYTKPFLYAGREIMIMRIEEYIGLLVSGGGMEGPVLRGVVCDVLNR